MYCVKCGIRNEEGWNFCVRCGARLIDPKEWEKEREEPSVPEGIIAEETAPDASVSEPVIEDAFVEEVSALETPPDDAEDDILIYERKRALQADAPAREENRCGVIPDEYTVRPFGVNPAQSPRPDPDFLKQEEIPLYDAPPVRDAERDEDRTDDAFPPDFDKDWPAFDAPRNESEIDFDEEWAEHPFLRLLTDTYDRLRARVGEWKRPPRDRMDIVEDDGEMLFGAELTGRAPVRRNQLRVKQKQTEVFSDRRPSSLIPERKKQTKVSSERRQNQPPRRREGTGRVAKPQNGAARGKNRDEKWFAYDASDDDFFGKANHTPRRPVRESFMMRHLRTIISLSALGLTLIILLLWMSFSVSGAVFSAGIGLGGADAARVAAAECERLGDTAGAIRFYTKALSLSDQYADAWALARAYRAAGELVNEARALQKCVDLDPGKSDSYYRLKELFPSAATRSVNIQILLSAGASRFGDPSLAE